METLDFAVIGAGWYGLGAAKQYHCQHPHHALAVFDAAAGVGGVWAKHRLYPGLKSNCLRGNYEYPDFPLTDDFGVPEGAYLSGRAVNTYLEAYAAHFGILDLFRGSTKVVAAEHQDQGGWVLTVEGTRGHATQIFARRLVVATGLASDPFLPSFPGQDEYGAPLFHPRDFMRQADETLCTSSTRRATVLGGSKSAWDVAYAFASRGIPVDQVIRRSGRGPCWMSPSFVTPFKRWIEGLVNVRVLTWFSPCVWSRDGGFEPARRLLHGTVLGRALVRGFWALLGHDVLSRARFDRHPETAKLKPWTDPFRVGCSFSILNYDSDPLDLVSQGVVKVHIADIDRLSHRKVHLDDGTVLESDVLVSSTGWKHTPPLKFLPEGIEYELGLPHFAPLKPTASDLASQRHLFDRADAEILSRFPSLRDLGSYNKNYVPLAEQSCVKVSKNELTPASPTSPFLMHRFMVPPSDRLLRSKDVVFAGFSMNFSNATTAHLQGLWATAYFDGMLARDPSAAADDSTALEQLRYEVVLHNRMGRWRYPHDNGATHPDFVFDAVPYLDQLLADLGLRVHRKRGWLAELTEPYTVADYRDVNDEYDARVGGLLRA